jgi:hypothetical protein
MYAFGVCITLLYIGGQKPLVETVKKAAPEILKRNTARKMLVTFSVGKRGQKIAQKVALFLNEN